jgi:HAD superfamily hydrolase (TIGR01509 family)
MDDGVLAALFDVDGTLVDSNYVHAVTWWEAFLQAGHEVPMTRIHRAIGMGSERLLEKLLPADRDREGDQVMLAAHESLYAAYWPKLRPLPGAAALLRACKARGLRVVLASSASARELEVLRKVIDAEDAVDAATSSGDVAESKPAADLVQVALEKAGVGADRAVFVGDTVWDVAACRKASVPCIALLSGGISAGELTDAGAAQVYHGPGDLLAHLQQSALAAPSTPGGRG